MRRLKASVFDRKFVSDVVYSHMRPSSLSERATPRAFYRFFRSFQSGAHIATVFVALCDRYSYEPVSRSRGEIKGQEEFTSRILKAFYAREEIEKKPPLINGWDIMKNLKIPSGRLVGLILDEIKSAHLLGIIKNKDEAIEYAKKIKDKIFIKDVTVVVPAFNEEKTISATLEKLSGIRKTWEVIVVDDGSTDRTFEIASGYNVRVIRHRVNMGKG